MRLRRGRAVRDGGVQDTRHLPACVRIRSTVGGDPSGMSAVRSAVMIAMTAATTDATTGAEPIAST